MKYDSQKPSSSRRNFLKQTGVATAGLVAGGLLSRTASALPPLPSNPATVDAMPTRNLGKTGYKVGIFSLGGQAFWDSMAAPAASWAYPPREPRARAARL